MLKYFILFLTISLVVSEEDKSLNNITYYTSFKLDKLFQNSEAGIYLLQANKFAYNDGEFRFFIEYQKASKRKDMKKGEFLVSVKY
jgi:hypothetical protein